MGCEGAFKTLNIKRNDTLPKPKGRIVESNVDNPGNLTAVDITGASILFIMVTDDDAKTVKVNSAATITDATNGEFEYTWAVGDTDTAGNFLGEFEITFSGGEKITLPADDTLQIRIRNDFDNA